MNQQERFRFFSVMQQFRKLNMGILIDGLSHSEFRILGMIHHGRFPYARLYSEDCSLESEQCEMDRKNLKQDVTVSELASKLSISLPAVSKMIGVLEERGLVKRYTDKADRRNKYVRLTEKGKALCLKNETRMKEFLEEVVNRMGKDEMKQLTLLLNRMHTVMEDIIEEDKSRKEDCGHD